MNENLSKAIRGMIKLKGGDTPCLAPERFLPMEVKRLMPFEIIKKDILGWANWNGIYWLIIREGDGKYIRVPFAKNKKWFDAMLSEIEFAPISELCQIFITGTA